VLIAQLFYLGSQPPIWSKDLQSRSLVPNKPPINISPFFLTTKKHYKVEVGTGVEVMSIILRTSMIFCLWGLNTHAKSAMMCVTDLSTIDTKSSVEHSSCDQLPGRLIKPYMCRSTKGSLAGRIRGVLHKIRLFILSLWGLVILNKLSRRHL